MDLHKHNEYLSKKITELEKEVNSLKTVVDSNTQNHSVFINNLLIGYSKIKLIYSKKNKVSDFEFIEINECFEKIIGISADILIGKKASMIIPDLFADKFHWLEFFEFMGVDTHCEKKETHSEFFDKWLIISAFCPENGIINVFLDDISRVKLHEIKVQWGEHKLLEKNQEIALQIEAYKSLNDGFQDLNAELQQNNTKLQKLNTKLSESENKYHILFDSTSEGFFIMTDLVIDCNKQACEIFGYTREEIIGKHPSELSPIYQPDGRKSMESANEKIQTALKGINQSFSWKHKRKDNSLIDAEISLKAIKIKDKTLIFATILDVSQKIKNEQKLKENEKKLSEVYQIARIGSWQLDVENREITLSKEHQLLIGIDNLSSMPISMSLFEYADKYIVPEDITVLLHQFQIAENASETHHVPEPFEYRIKFSSGEYRYMSVHAKFFDKGFIYGITQDITERKLAELKLKNTDIILKGINQASGILLTENIFLTAIQKSLDITGRTSGLSKISIYTNHSDSKENNYYNQKFEWSPENYIVDNPAIQNIYFSENGITRWYEILNNGETIKGVIKDFPYKEQMFLEKKDVLALFLVPLFVEKKFWGFISFEKNKNFQKWSSAEENILSNFSNSIGGLIAKQIRNEEIIWAKEKAQESDRLKSAFLANMSHEIRTPMNAILGFTELLKDESLSRYTRNEFIEIINSRGKDLLQIINDIIDISKIEAGQIKINPGQCSLNAVLMELYSFFETNLNLKDKKNIILRIHATLPNDQSMVYIDDIRLKQIFTNLLGNAIKFTEKGFIEFGYKQDGNVLHFYVEDSGIGIPKEKQALIFDRFRQADDSTTKNFGGTGLGLAISKSLTELMGGNMKLESELGEGSRFSFFLPYIPFKNNKPNEQTSNPISPESVDWKDKLILIVEDDNINFHYLQVLLRKTQANIIRAENGIEAVEICRNNKEIDIVLMDMQMPIMNGFEATRIIKGFKKDLPIIAQTAYAMAEDKEKCKAAGCDDYITKPIDIKALITITGKYFLN